MNANAQEEPAKVNVLELLQQAQSCPPITNEELRGALSLGGAAARHLATVVVMHCAEFDFGLKDYLTNSRAEGVLISLAREQHIHKTRRAAIRERHQGIQEQSNAAAAGYTAVLREVDVHIAEFDEQYRLGNKLDQAALGELYDHTDDLGHPALSALPPPTAFEGNARDALIHADRFVRFMVTRAMATENQPVTPLMLSADHTVANIAQAA